MTHVSISIEIEVPAAAAWKIVGGYDNLPQWLDLVQSSTLEDGGRVRRLHAVGGAVIVEQMLSFDELMCRFSYRHIEAPDPVSDYVAEMQVDAIGDHRCRVTWASSFNPRGVDENAAVAHVKGIYKVGLANLKRVLEA